MNAIAFPRRRQTPPVGGTRIARWRLLLAVALGGAGAALASLGVVDSRVMVTLVGGLCLVGSAYAALPASVFRDPLNPALLLGASISLLTIGRAIYVDNHGAFFLVYTRQYSLASHSRDFALGVLAELLAAALFIGGVAIATRLRRAPRDGPPQRAHDDRILRAGLWLGAAVTLTVLAVLVAQAGGPTQYVDELKARAIFFKDRGPLFVLISAFPAAVLAWFCVHLSRKRPRSWWRLAGSLLVAAGLVTLATGARTYPIFLLGVPALLAVHLRVRAVRWREVAVVAAVIFLAASGYRAVGRSQDPLELQGQDRPGVTGFVINAFASADTRLPDTVATIRAESLPSQDGKTLAGALATPVPRGLWPGKPLSANDRLSAAVVPGPNKAPLGITFAGEAVWNFGWPGLLLFAPLGFVVGTAYRSARRDPGNALRIVAYGAALGTMLVLARTDAYDTAIAFGSFFVPALTLVALSAWVADRAE